MFGARHNGCYSTSEIGRVMGTLMAVGKYDDASMDNFRYDWLFRNLAEESVLLCNLNEGYNLRPKGQKSD